MDKVLIGVIGCGRIAQTMHLPYLAELNQFEVVAICDMFPQLLDYVGNKYHIKKRYPTHKDLLEQNNIDAVLICTPTKADVAKDSANAGKHILVEKPLSFDVAEADEVIEAAKANDVQLMVAYNKRYDPGFEVMQELLQGIQDTKLVRVHDLAGAIHFALGDIYRTYPFERKSKPSLLAVLPDVKVALSKILKNVNLQDDLILAYDVLLHVCSHDINLLRAIYGEPNEVLFSHISHKGWHNTSVLSYHDFTCVWESGAFDFTRTWMDEEIAVFSSSSTISIRFPNPFIKNLPTLVELIEMDGQKIIEKKITPSYQESFKRELIHFHDCIINDKEPLTNGDDAKRDIQVLQDIINKAAESKKTE